jgi:hypothetical protein
MRAQSWVSTQSGRKEAIVVKAMWMIRAGEDGKKFDDFKSHSLVAIGWTELGDMSDLKTRDDFTRAVTKTWPQAKPMQVSMSASQAFRFVREIKIGDRVLTYDPSERIYLVGTISGDYRYDQARVGLFANVRDVMWDGQVSREQLSVSTRNSLGAVSTLFQLSADPADEIEELLVSRVLHSGLATQDLNAKPAFSLGTSMDLSNIRSLLPEFRRTFLDTPAGRDHLSWFSSGRARGQANLEDAKRRADAGEDVTDLVLSKLLPHLDSPHNLERGAWCCIAPAVTRNIRQWFEGVGWAKSEDWPKIARLILKFIRAVTSDPSRLAVECEAFRHSSYSKGFQSGFLSPILNAVRPSDFAIVNSKTKRTLKGLANLTCKTHLADYPTSNMLVRSIVAELSDELPSDGDAFPGDVFDAFCHWWVAIYKGSGDEAIEKTMRHLFADDSVRMKACELMAEHIELANGQSASCWEITVRPHRVRLNIGRFAGLELRKNKLRLGLVPEDVVGHLRDQFQAEGRWSTEFPTTPVTRLCEFEPDEYFQRGDALAPSVKEFVSVAAHTALLSPFRKSHSPEFLDYLEDALARGLPHPRYRETPVTPAFAKPVQKLAMEPAIRFDARQSLFHKVDYTVGHLVSSIELGDIGLPELQRPFVWDRTKVRDLLDSMYRGFPVGFLLLWSNALLQTGKQIGTDAKQMKVPGYLVVDGQQRLTSLFAVFTGAAVLDANFASTRVEIAFRPRDGRFAVADAATRLDPEFFSNISSLLSAHGGGHGLVTTFLAKLKDSKEIRQQDEDIIRDNISRLQNLINYQLTALVIQTDVLEDEVADIFVRINNQGVKLDQADFILTLLSVFWPEGRKQLEDFAKAAKQPPVKGGPPSPFNYLIQPGPDQMLRASIGFGFHRGRMKAVYQVLRGRDPDTGQFLPTLRDEQFARLKDAQPKVLDLNNWHAYLHALRSAGFVGPDTISSENAIIYTYVHFLLGKYHGGLPEPALSRLIRRWFATVTLSARYSVSPESTMDGDLADLKGTKTADEFASSLERKIETTLTGDFWSITLPAALETSAALAPEMLAFRAAQAVLSAPVLFSDKKVRDLLDPAMRPPTKSLEQHHLFPKGWLKHQGVTTPKRINQVANLALLEWPKNRDLSDLPPSEYVPRLREEFSPGQWTHMEYLHALPQNWESMEYEHFLELRRKLMAQIIKQAFLALSPHEEDGALTIADASAEESRVWPLVQALEERLRRSVRTKYNSEWGEASDKQIGMALGEQDMVSIGKYRAKHLSIYGGAIDGESADLLDYCYLGQLARLMLSNNAWKLFQPAFRDKRQLEDLINCVIPVRNDLAHFRRVPAKELDRCRIAADDLIGAADKL